MFALKTIQIPLPGRHPPSPILSNGHSTPPRPCSSSQQTASSRRHLDFLDSFSSLKLKSSSEKKVSPAMSSLQGYYGLRPINQKGGAEGFEMSVYQKGQSHYLEDGPFLKCLPNSNPPLNHHRKSRSAANCLASDNGNLIDQDSLQEVENNDTAKWNENLVSRRQKSESDFTSRAPEKLLKEDNTSNNSISAITGKGLALRPKSSSIIISGSDSEVGTGFNPIPNMGLFVLLINSDLRFFPFGFCLFWDGAKFPSYPILTATVPILTVTVHILTATVPYSDTKSYPTVNPVFNPTPLRSGLTKSGLTPVQTGPIGLGDSFLTDDVDGARKSSSASSLQDSDNSALSSIWPSSKWNLRPDFQALSAAAISIPIFDGLGKPCNRRNKASLD